jgi:hypothetical protein
LRFFLDLLERPDGFVGRVGAEAYHQSSERDTQARKLNEKILENLRSIPEGKRVHTLKSVREDASEAPSAKLVIGRELLIAAVSAER